MGILNHNDIDIFDVYIDSLEFPFEFYSEPVPDQDTTPIKSIDDDEMDHFLELFQSDHDDDIFDVDLHML